MVLQFEYLILDIIWNLYRISQLQITFDIYVINVLVFTHRINNYENDFDIFIYAIIIIYFISSVNKNTLKIQFFHFFHF